MQNTIKVLVDLKKEMYRFDQAQQGDDVILDITLLENGVAKDLTGETVELIYINANNTVASVTGDKMVVNGNNVKITCPTDCTRSYGIAKFQLKVVSTYQVSTFPIALTIVPGVDQNQQISQNISTILEQLTSKNIECGETLESLKAWISTGNLVNADLESNIGTGDILNADLEDNITTVTQLKTVLTNVINTGNELDTSLDEKISVGNTLDATLKTDTETANTAKENLQNVIETADTTTYASQGQVTEINSQLADMATYDDSSKIDDREQLQDMINKASIKGNSVLLKPNHTYIINSANPEGIFGLLTLKPNTKIKGNGATIKIADGLNSRITFNNLFSTDETVDVNNGSLSFKNLTFDLNGQANLTPNGSPKNNCAVFAHRFYKVVYNDCDVLNAPGNQCVFLVKPSPKSSVYCNRNRFNNVADSIVGNWNADHSSIYIVSEYAEVNNNVFENDVIPSNACAIEVHCKYSSLRNNEIINYNHGIYPAAHSATYNLKTDIETCFIENNVFINNSAPLVLWTALDDGGFPTSIGTVKFNNNKVYCTGGSKFVNANTELLGNGVDRFEITDNEFIIDGTGGNVIDISEKVNFLLVKNNAFKNSNNIAIYSKALNNIIEDNEIIDCIQAVAQNAVIWIDGASDILKINNNKIKQNTVLAIYAINISCTINDGEILDNSIIGFSDNQIRFTNNGILDTNKCILRHKTVGDYHVNMYGLNGSEYVNTTTGTQYIINGTLFSKSWVLNAKTQNITFDTTMLPDTFKLGVSYSIVNGDTLLPSTIKQGILKVEKLNESTSFRKFIIEWFYPANGDATTLADMYYRKGLSGTNDWSVWKKLTGV